MDTGVMYMKSNKYRLYANVLKQMNNSLIISICYILCSISASAENSNIDKNILKNASFENMKSFCSYENSYENSKPFYGWNCFGDWGQNISVGREAIAGNTSAVFTSPCWITRGVKVKPGNTYAISGYFRTALHTMPTNSNIGAFIEIKTDKKLLFVNYISGIHDWTKVSGKFSVPSEISWVKINIGIKVANGIAWADGFKIECIK